MADRAEVGGGFSVLDGAALITGAAVASVHLRGLFREGATPYGWLVVWVTFACVAVTASGPFLYLVRRFVRPLRDYPQIGDRLWSILGLPWLLTAFIHSTTAGDPRRDELLSVGLAIVSAIALGAVWRTWVMVPPEQVTRGAWTSWTNRLGLILSIAWPVQWGLVMVVVS